MTGQPLNGVLRDLLRKLRGSMVDLRSRSMTVTSAGEPGVSVPRQPEDARRSAGEQLDELAEREMPWPHQVLEADREGRLEPENAERRQLELETLLVRGVRRVVARDGVHRAVGDRGQQGFAIAVGAQRADSS